MAVEVTGVALVELESFRLIPTLASIWADGACAIAKRGLLIHKDIDSLSHRNPKRQ
ncbi:MAG: hypothetical protein JNM43_19900 [Planctomycetaceae bacterium]|nr:hypothetical protein [Planctomycetaceae bacterium]